MKYKQLLDSIKESNIYEDDKLNDRVLLIDSMNMALRSFSIINKFNQQGHHIGLLTGYLRSLGAMIDQIQPTRVIVVFDGEGNTTNKKNLYSEYKGTRKIKRITNWTGFDNLEQESESLQDQLLRLIDYLKCLPLSISIVDKLEADDSIAFLSQKFDHSIIVSVDQDFLQLVDDKVEVYSPIRKKYYTKQAVFDEFGVWPCNFLMKKIILGDTSDNVPKVPKIGPGKLYKLFPELTQEQPISLQEIIDKSYIESDNNPWYGDIYNFKHQLYINEKLMDLKNPNIPEQEKEKLEKLVLSKPNSYNKSKFYDLYHEDKLENSIPGLGMWLTNNFQPLDKYK